MYVNSSLVDDFKDLYNKADSSSPIKKAFRKIDTDIQQQLQNYAKIDSALQEKYFIKGKFADMNVMWRQQAKSINLTFITKQFNGASLSENDHKQLDALKAVKGNRVKAANRIIFSMCRKLIDAFFMIGQDYFPEQFEELLKADKALSVNYSPMKITEEIDEPISNLSKKKKKTKKGSHS